MRSSRRDRPVRVLIAHHHQLFSEGMKATLSASEDVEVVGEARSAREAVALTEKTNPDVVVLGAGLPGVGARGALEGMAAMGAPPATVVVSHSDSVSRTAADLLKSGAAAYLGKNASLEDLHQSLLLAARRSPDEPGETLFAGVREDIDNGNLQEARLGDTRLSERELDVVLLAAQGLSNRQIANSICLTEATVKRHLANIYRKLGVASRQEATRKTLDEGWISVQDLTGDLRKEHGVSVDRSARL